MKVIENEHCVFFDCDDTLVMWDNVYKNEDHSNCILVTDPVSGFSASLVPHEAHIRYLKESRSHHCTIVVWSAGGWQWAKAVVEALGLEEYVDAVMAKPDRYVDDLPCTKFMGDRIYKVMNNDN